MDKCVRGCVRLENDPGPRDHAAAVADERRVQALVGVIPPVPEPGHGRGGPVQVSPGLQHVGVAEPAEFEEVPASGD